MDQSEVTRLLSHAEQLRAAVGDDRLHDFLQAGRVGDHVAAEIKLVSLGGMGGGPVQTVPLVSPVGAIRPLGGLVPTVSTDASRIFVPQLFAPPAEAAAPRVEGTAKPENAQMMAEGHSLPLETIAAWIKTTRQALDDVGTLRVVLDQLLAWDVNRSLEGQCIYGDGVSPNLLGFMASVPAAAAPPAGLSKLDQLLNAAATISTTSRYLPTGAIVNPADAVDIAKAQTGSYVFFPPSYVSQFRIYATSLMGAGDFVVGAFDPCAALYIREPYTVRLAYSNVDDFTKNLVTVLGEIRAALAVFVPTAFLTGDFV